MVSLRLPLEARDQLQAMSRGLGLSQADIIVRALEALGAIHERAAADLTPSKISPKTAQAWGTAYALLHPGTEPLLVGRAAAGARDGANDEQGMSAPEWVAACVAAFILSKDA